MKKILLFALPLLAMCFASCEKDNGNNGGDEVELSGDDVIPFKDPNFLKALLVVQEIEIYDAETGEWIPYTTDVDKNKDGQITVNEAMGVRGLVLSDYETGESFNVYEMSEIKYFTALEFLDCSYNQLTSLDLSNNIALLSLYCEENQLTSLDVSNCTALTSLECWSNQLTSINLSGCTKLKEIFCEENYLSSIDLSQCESLETLYCKNNRLTSLNFDSNPSFEHVECDYNQIQNLTFPNNPKLHCVRCGNNQIQLLDITKNPNVIDLRAENNQIVILDLSNQKTVTNNTAFALSLQNNPLQTLYFADTEDGRKLAQWTLDYVTSNPQVIYK